MTRKILVVFGLLLILTARISAQENLGQTTEQLKVEIARRETIDRDEATPAAQRLTNRANLENARAALLKDVELRIAALEKYLSTLGDSITPAEREEARKSLQQLSADVNISVEKKSVNTFNSSASVTVSSPPSSAAIVSANNAPLQTALTIVRPANNSSAEKEVEVVVQVDSPAGSALIVRATVTNNGNQVDVAEFVIEANKTVGKTTVQLGPGDNVITVVAPSTPALTATVTVSGGDDRKTPFTRAIFGIEQAAAASAKPEQKLFLEFNLTAPLFKNGKTALDAPVWLWLNPRITSLPQQISSTVAEFATAASFTAPFETGKVNDIAQGFEFLGGVEVKLPGGLTGPIPSGFGGETKARFGISLVFAAGMSTPFGSQQVAPQFFKVNPTVKERFHVPEGKEFIAFVSADRNRFFRQYYGGLRLKTYYVRKHTNELDNVFPGIIDLTFGQNESITGGGLYGGIARLDGIYPLPFIRGKYKGSLYVFGSALMKLSKPKIPPTVILQPPDTPPDINSDKVLIQQVPMQDADHYRLGVGVDLIRLLKP